MDSGSIKFVVTVNDSAGNSYTSSEHQGFVPVINHPPEAQNITLSRSSSLILLPIYTKHLVVEEFGKWALLEVTSQVFVIFIGLIACKPNFSICSSEIRN